MQRHVGLGAQGGATGGAPHHSPTGGGWGRPSLVGCVGRWTSLDAVGRCWVPLDVVEFAIIAQEWGRWGGPEQVGYVLPAPPPSIVHVVAPVWHTTAPGEALGV